jgi:hypothetical protein
MGVSCHNIFVDTSTGGGRSKGHFTVTGSRNMAFGCPLPHPQSFHVRSHTAHIKVAVVAILFAPGPGGIQEQSPDAPSFGPCSVWGTPPPKGLKGNFPFDSEFLFFDFNFTKIEVLILISVFLS